MTAKLKLAWRLARRELRSGFSGFFVFLACLTLGVAAIAAVGVINAGVLEGLEEDSASLLGGDIKFQSTNFPMDEDELAALMPVDTRRGDVVRTNAMVEGGWGPEGGEGRRVVVGLKAVDNAYPLIGNIQLDPLTLTMPEALSDLGAVVERGLLARLGIEIGDPLRIGEAMFTVRAVVDREPDRVGAFISIGPRVFIHLDDLAKTEVIQPGSLARYDYRFAMPPGIEAAPLLADIKKNNPEPSWQVNGVRDIQPRVTRVVDRLASFLTIAGLASLLIGGVGVALAIQNYLAGKTSTIATLKCLGAPSNLIFWIYLLQVLTLALVGIAIGLAIGQSIPWLVRELTEGLLPVQIRTGFYPLPLAIAAGCGLLTALTFAIWPLARAKDVSPAGMFRALLSPPERWPSLSVFLLLGACILGLAGLAIFGVNDKLLALIFVGVAIAAALLLTGFAKLLLLLTKTVGKRGGARWRMAIANLHRPGAHATSVVVALGAGLTVLTLVAVLHSNLDAEVDQSFGNRVPAVFFIDIQKDHLDRFEQVVADADDANLLQTIPTIRGRVVRVKGVPANQTGIRHWTLRHDRALSYSATMPENTEIVAGDWWPPDYRGAPLIAIEDDVAEAYDIGVGDMLGFNVLGRVIEAEVAVVRKEIDWTQGRLDAVFLFSPGVLGCRPTQLCRSRRSARGCRARSRWQGRGYAPQRHADLDARGQRPHSRHHGEGSARHCLGRRRDPHLRPFGARRRGCGGEKAASPRVRRSQGPGRQAFGSSWPFRH